MSNTRKNRWKLRLITAMIGIIAALIVGEIAVRMLGINPQLNIIYRENYQLSDNAILEYELVPGSLDGQTTISRQGLRDREYTIPKPDNVFRIAVIGDSVTYGFHCPRAKTFVKQFETMIEQIAPAGSPVIEVINLGVVGYNIHQIVERLRVKGLPFQPDLILYAYVLNDPQSFSLQSASLKSIEKQVQRDTAKKIRNGLSRMLRHSQLYVLIQKSLIQRPQHTGETLHDPGFETLKTGGHVEYIRQLYKNDESWKRVRKGFSDLAAITQQPLSIPLVIILFPIEWKNTADPYPLTDVHQKIMDETTRNGLDVFDLTNAMNIAHQLNSGRIYNDFLHPSIFGHRLYAASILKYLCETNRLPNSDEMKQNFGLLKDDPLLEKVLRE